jgi:hypothetical protein
MDKDVILEATEYSRDLDGTHVVKCPHCQRWVGIEDGPFKGEQYTDNVCGGTFEVSESARFVRAEYD